MKMDLENWMGRDQMGIFIFWEGQMTLYIYIYIFGGFGGRPGPSPVLPKPASDYDEIICFLIYFLSNYCVVI